MRDLDDSPKYLPILTTRADLEAQVHHSVQPTVVAFVLFGVLAGPATMLLTILGSSRMIRQARPMDRTADALGCAPITACAPRGAGPPEPFAALRARGRRRILRLAQGTGGRSAPSGAARGFVAGYSRRVPGARRIRAPRVLVAVVAVAWNTSSARTGARPCRPRSTRARDGPAVADGVRTALSTRRGGVLLTGACCVAVTALVAATVFGANLTTLVGNSQRYGWPWDVGVLTDYGYGGTDVQQVHADLPPAMNRVLRPHRVRGRNTRRCERGDRVRGRARRPRSISRWSTAARPERRTKQRSAPRPRTTSASTSAIASRSNRHRIASGRGRRHDRAPAIGQYLSDRSGLGVGVFTLVPARRFDDQAVTFIGMHRYNTMHLDEYPRCRSSNWRRRQRTSIWASECVVARRPRGAWWCGVSPTNPTSFGTRCARMAAPTVVASALIQ